MRPLKIYFGAALAMSAGVWAIPAKSTGKAHAPAPAHKKGPSNGGSNEPGNGGGKGSGKGDGDDVNKSGCFGLFAENDANPAEKVPENETWLLELDLKGTRYLMPAQGDDVDLRAMATAIFKQPQGPKGGLVDAQRPNTLYFVRNTDLPNTNKLVLSSQSNAGTMVVVPKMVPDGVVHVPGYKWAFCYPPKTGYIILSLIKEEDYGKTTDNCYEVKVTSIAEHCDEKRADRK